MSKEKEDVYLDAAKAGLDGEASNPQYAQISIAISLQRIAEALEPIAIMLGEPKLIYNPAMFDSPMGDELKKAGMIADPPPLADELKKAGWGGYDNGILDAIDISRLASDMKSLRAALREQVRDPETRAKVNAPASPVVEFEPMCTWTECPHCHAPESWSGSICRNLECPFEYTSPVDPFLQTLANLCERHRCEALPVPESPSCARCAEERTIVCPQCLGELVPKRDGSGDFEACVTCGYGAATVAVSQPATFESLAPAPLTETPAECWCGAGPDKPVHDKKYGSHDFGVRPEPVPEPPMIALSVPHTHICNGGDSLCLKTFECISRCYNVEKECSNCALPF